MIVGKAITTGAVAHSVVVGETISVTADVSGSVLANAAAVSAAKVEGSVIVGKAALTATTTTIIGSLIATEDALSLSATAATATVSNSLILGKAHDIDYGLTSVQINGQDNKVAIQRAIQYSLVHGNSNNLGLDSSLIFGASNVAKCTVDGNSKFAFMFGRENHVESTSNNYNSVQNHIHGEGFWVQDSKYVVAMGGDILSTTPITDANNDTKILQSDNATVLGRKNTLIGAADSVVIGNDNTVNWTAAVIPSASALFKNIKILGDSNIIKQSRSTDAITNIIVAATEAIVDTTTNAAGSLGQINYVNVYGFAPEIYSNKAGVGSSGDLIKSSSFGQKNKIKVYDGEIKFATLVGSNNTLFNNQSAAITEDFQIFGNDNEVNILDGVATVGYKDIETGNVLGSYADTASYINVAKIFRSWDGRKDNVKYTSSAVQYKGATSTDGSEGDNVHDGLLTTLIGNGIDAAGANKYNAMAIGSSVLYATDGSTSLGRRQIIVLPVYQNGSGTKAQYTSNPINPTNGGGFNAVDKAMSLPTYNELFAAGSNGQQFPVGTICLAGDGGDAVGGAANLMVWTGNLASY